LALKPPTQVFPIGGRDHFIVIIPTAPTPVGSDMLFVPTDSVLATDTSIDAFAGSFVSLGVGIPPFVVGDPI